jgi:hypothetical protein
MKIETVQIGFFYTFPTEWLHLVADFLRAPFLRPWFGKIWFMVSPQIFWTGQSYLLATEQVKCGISAHR